MSHPAHTEAVDRLLTSIYPSGERLLSSFLFGKPEAPHWQRNLGAEIYVQPKEYIRALLFLRQNGAHYLRAISISELWSMATNFLTDNFWYIKAGMFVPETGRPYAAYVSVEDKLALAKALEKSVIFQPRAELTLYPLFSVRVANNFENSKFFLINSSDLSTHHFPDSLKTLSLAPEIFPPIVDWEGRKHITVSWLGIRSPLPLISKKIAAAILGAIALAPPPRHRYMFSERQVFGGRFTAGNSGYAVSGGMSPHTPPIMSDIILTKNDHNWLEILPDLLGSVEISSRRKLRALEYFYRAWFHDPRERFPVLCMSLDSLVGVTHAHTSAAIQYVKETISSTIDDDRLRLLMRVRGAVVHGAAPDVYESENYEAYYEAYETDPIYDLELVVAKCLREDVFDGTLKCHFDKHIERMGNKAIKPRTLRDWDAGCIIEDYT